MANSPFGSFEALIGALQNAKATESMIDNVKLLSSQMNDIVLKSKAIKDNEEDRLETQKQIYSINNSLYEQVLLIFQARREGLLRQVEDMEKLKTTNQEIVAKLKETREELKENQKYISYIRVQREETKNKVQEIVDKQKKLNDALETQEKTAKRIKKATEDASSNLGSSILNTFKLNNFSETLLGKYFKLKRAGGDFKEAIKGAGIPYENMGKSLTAAEMSSKLLYKALQAIKKVTLETLYAVNSLMAETSKLTGLGRASQQEIIEVGFDVTNYAVSFEEVNSSYQNLFSNMSMFTTLSKKQRVELSALSAALQNLGVDGNISAEMFEVLTKGLNMAAGEIPGVTKELIGLARELKVPPKIIMGDFSKAMVELAARGREAIKVYKELAAVSKLTGTSISDLQGIFGESLNTWDGVSKMASRVNIMLGGQFLDSVKLIYATESERIRMLLSAIERSGKSFENMTFFEKKAFAAAAGIKDMAKANKILSLSLGAYDEMISKADAARISQQKFEEAAKASADITKKLTIIKRNFTVKLLPLIKAVNYLLDGIINLTKNMHPYYAVMGSVLLVVGSVALALSGIYIAGLMAGKGFVAAGAGAAAGAPGLTALGKAAEGSVVGLLLVMGTALSVGAGMLMLGKGLHYVGLGFAAALDSAGRFLQVLDGLKNIQADQIVSTIGGIGLAVANLASTRVVIGAVTLSGIASSLKPIGQVASELDKIENMQFKSVQKLHEHLKGISALGKSLKPVVSAIAPVTDDSTSASKISKASIQNITLKSPKVVVMNENQTPIFKIDSLNLTLDPQDPKGNGQKLSDAMMNSLLGRKQAAV